MEEHLPAAFIAEHYGAWVRVFGQVTASSMEHSLVHGLQTLHCRVLACAVVLEVNCVVLRGGAPLL